MTIDHVVYGYTSGYSYDDEGCGMLFVSEDAVRQSLHNDFAKASGVWTEERHPNGDLIIRFREETPVRRLVRYRHEFWVSPYEVYA